VFITSVTCSLQFSKAGSAAALSQQENNNSADVQRDRENITGFISLTHKRTDGRDPVWGSEFTLKAALKGGVQQSLLLSQAQISGFCVRACLRARV
jgi:hypothetical protein